MLEKYISSLFTTFPSEEIFGLSVTVIYQDLKDKDEGAAEFCREIDWRYCDYRNMVGCEDEAVIVMDCLSIEPISRPHNLLVVVTTPHARYNMFLTE